MQEGEKRDLCSECKKFYGSQENNGLCSSCFKSHLIKVLGSQATSTQSEKNTKDVKEIKESPAVPEGPKQEDNKKCWKCKIRVGYLGYTCKCGYTYCAEHRYFDTHDCTYDYKKEGKEKLGKANPTVAADKLEKL